MIHVNKSAKVMIHIEQDSESFFTAKEVKKEISEAKQLLAESKKQFDQLTENSKKTTFVNLMDNSVDTVQKIIGFLPTPAQASLAQVNRQCSKIVAQNSIYQLENCLKNYLNSANSLLEIFHRPEHSQALAEVDYLDLTNFWYEKPHENEFLIKLAQAIVLKCPKLIGLFLSTPQIEILTHLKSLKNQLRILSINQFVNQPNRKYFISKPAPVDQEKLTSLVSEFTELVYLQITVIVTRIFDVPPPAINLESWQRLKKVEVIDVPVLDDKSTQIIIIYPDLLKLRSRKIFQDPP